MIEDADKRVQDFINATFDRLMIREKFKWEHARRASAQRLRNDGRERKHGKAQGVGVGVRAHG